MRWSSIVLAALVVVALSAPAAAATLKVPKGYETIQEAVDAAGPGDTIVVSKGTYYENVVANVDGLRFIGKGAIWDGNIQGNLGNCLQAEADDILVQGFRFRHGRDQVYISGDDSVIEKNTINVVEDGDGIYASGDGIRVEKNTEKNADGNGVEISGDGNRLEKCVALKCTDDGFCIEQGSDGTEIDGCSATACDGEGIENFGLLTDVTNSKFRGNRIDVTNDGTFDQFTGNTFKTGGTDTPAEVDAQLK